jgi:kynurenine formamidase
MRCFVQATNSFVGTARAAVATSLLIGAMSVASPVSGDQSPTFVDLSLPVASEYPCTWPAGMLPFRIDHVQKIGRQSAYNIDTLTIDGNTSTQLDAPPHSVLRPELNLPKSGPYGLEFTDKTPAWKFVGEACVVDVSKLLDITANGVSPLVRIKHFEQWQEQHRPFRIGDVVLMRSGYSDKYYQPFPADRRFVADPLEKKAPGWPDAHPDAMEYLALRKVFHIGTDSPSMGPIGDLAEPSHYAALKYGAVFTEGATNLAKLPATGAFYCMMGPKHKDGAVAEGRSWAIVGNPLAKQLIESARKKRAIDLSVTLAIDCPMTWPGKGIGNHRHLYTKAHFSVFTTHIMDSHAGTHLVPPAYALPPENFDPTGYAPQTHIWLDEYEEKYGPRGISDVTADKVPLSQTCGWARVIDVQHLVGTTTRAHWPASPEITVEEIEAYESRHGDLEGGEIVIFHSGHTNRHFKPMPEGSACLAHPINGRSEGWPAPGPDAIVYLAKKGIRCVATDGPTLGGVDPKRAMMTYWALGSQGMVAVEFLIDVDKLPQHAYFLFAPVKILHCHGGPGRAIALY